MVHKFIRDDQPTHKSYLLHVETQFKDTQTDSEKDGWSMKEL